MDTKTIDLSSYTRGEPLIDAETFREIERKFEIAEHEMRLQDSRREGREESNREAAQKMLELNQPYSLISQVTGYTEEEIKKIAAKM